MVGLEAITEVTEKRPQLQGTAQELARKQRSGKGKSRGQAKRSRSPLLDCSVLRFPRGGTLRTPTPAPNPPLSCSRGNSASKYSDLLLPLPPIFLTTRFVSSRVRRRRAVSSRVRRRRAPGPESSLLGDRRRPLIRRSLPVLDCRGVEIGLNQLFV